MKYYSDKLDALYIELINCIKDNVKHKIDVSSYGMISNSGDYIDYLHKNDWEDSKGNFYEFDRIDLRDLAFLVDVKIINKIKYE